jgi:hypothetical protein
MICLKKLLKSETGQSSVLMAFIFVVLCGATALSVDIGHVSVEKSALQNAADAAALSAAYELPSSAAVRGAAASYAGLNGVEGAELTVNTPYDGDPNKVEVICTKTVDYTFARVLGLRSVDISARAVAENSGGISGGPFAYTIFFGCTANTMMFSSSNLYVEGSIHSNSVLQLNGSCQTVTETAEAVSHFYTYTSSVTIDTIRGRTTTVSGSDIHINHRINSPAPVIAMPDFSGQVQAEAGQVYTGYTMFYGSSINVDSPIYVDGSVMFSGSNISGQGTILASGSIQFNGSSIVNSPDDAVCFYSKNGNIQINGSNIELDGIVYAPNGMVQINASNVVIHGRIIADRVQLNGSNIQIISGDGDLDCLPEGSIKLVE